MTDNYNFDESKGGVEGLVTVPSDFGPDETMARLEKAIVAQGMKVFSRIDHAALAAEAGMTLRPTEVLFFGNPRGGTPLMQASQTIGIDLPLKALVWQDASGKHGFPTTNRTGWQSDTTRAALTRKWQRCIRRLVSWQVRRLKVKHNSRSASGRI